MSIEDVTDRKGWQRCERCNEKLKPGTEVYLELNNKTGLYSDPDKVNLGEDESQGGFPFGKACAKRVLANGGKGKDYR